MKPAAPDRIAPMQEGDRRQRPQENADDDGDDDADDGDRRVLALEVGCGAFLDGCGDLDHALVARRHGEHLAAGDNPVEHGEHAADRSRCKAGLSRIHAFTLPCLFWRADAAGERGAPGIGPVFRERLRGWQPRGLNGLAQEKREHHAGREAANADHPLAKGKAGDADRANAQNPVSPAASPARRRWSGAPTRRPLRCVPIRSIVVPSGKESVDGSTSGGSAASSA